ncbi:UvrD-helicase domain-containing protein [Aureibacillus halotolerans]|uniref:DNA 3'-5' helicase n=1 Tax=Aureibacillus halotolerans TaxID=1508390 RepID=A0A4R6TPJ3_9BACI|nr:UvrD-helicase domain-containing protein [Aureibacillus halotolerans]TDQ33796.1 DNA helicase-2/ATP-dependent DNA helicase PcrA [Aureibacillus halotolerans]
MTNNKFTETPFQTSVTIPQAPMAETTTSRTLVPPEAPDAFYFRALEQRGIHLNEPQIEAVRHGDGPLLVLAGAGSGKTSVLVGRVGYLCAVRQIDPNALLLVTFSKKAADEMKQRVAQLPGMDAQQAKRIKAQTYHSFFLRVIKQNGIDKDILGSGRQEQIAMKKIIKGLGFQDRYQPETILSLLSFYKLQLKNIRELGDAVEKEIKDIFLAYEDWKAQNNYINFDDVLLMAYELLSKQPDVLAALQKQCRYLLVDEFQDTNLVQYKLIQMIAQPQNNLMVVGDDDQTIYSFNGADSDFILAFDRQYPNAETVTLDINYRSTQRIIGLGNAVIHKNKRRKEKTLKATNTSPLVPRYLRPTNSDDEAERLIELISRIVQQKKQSYKDIAVLFRSSANSRAMLEQLALSHIPYMDYGDKETFYDHWVVKPLLAHLRLSLDPQKLEAIDDVLPTLYIPRDKGREFLQNKERIHANDHPFDHLNSFPSLKGFQQKQVTERIALVPTLHKMKPQQAIQKMRQAFYDAYLQANQPSKFSQYKENLLDQLDELESSAARFLTVTEFIHFIDEFKRKREAMMARGAVQNDEDAVSLMTIHKSKGMEFPIVFLIGASEGTIPHHSIFDASKMKDTYPSLSQKQKVEAALEEERRLAYVAITRAKSHLVVSSPKSSQGRETDISRFFSDIFQDKATQNPSPRPVRGGKMETVNAWICTGHDCIVWQRISNHKEAQLDSKPCPICQSPMEKGRKDVLQTSSS